MAAAVMAAQFLVAALIPAAEAAPIPGSNCNVFPTDSIWNYDVSSLPVHPRSDAWMASTGAGQGSTKKLHPDFGTPPYGIPYAVVGNGHQQTNFQFLYASESDPNPYPFGPDIPIEQGSDAHALIVNRDTCKLYELGGTGYAGPGTAWAGAIFDLNSNALRPDTWTSADAAGLPILPGLVRVDEVQAGLINHAVRFTVNTSDRSYLWPARHQAGSVNDPNVPPMGARFRLKAGYDISGYGTEARVVLRAMQKYGMFVADNGSDWFFTGTEDQGWGAPAMDSMITQLKQVPANQFEAVDESGVMVDPNSGGTVRPQCYQQLAAGGVARGQAASWAPGRLDLFQRSSGNTIRHEWWGGPPWGGPESLSAPPGGLASEPVAVSWAPNRLDVFAIGADGSLYHKWWDGSAWRGWELQGSPGSGLTGQVTVAAWSANRLDIVARTGTPSALWHKWWDGSSWSGWEAHGSPAASVGDPSVVSWEPGRLDLFAVGADGKLYHQWWPGGWLGSWEGQGSPGSSLSSGAPAVVAWGPNRLDILLADAQVCSLWHRWWNGAGWSGWESHVAPSGSSVAFDPVVVSWAPGRLDVFVVGSGGRLLHRFLIGGWSGWEDQGKPASALTGRPAVVCWAPNRLDVFVRDGSGRVYHNWWNAVPPWGFWEDHGVP